MPLMIIIEIVSFMIRPFALTIRLFANMLAGHAVLAVLLGLIVSLMFAAPAIAVAVGVFMLEIIVALIQSYIFIMLTATFMGLTMHPRTKRLKRCVPATKCTAELGASPRRRNLISLLPNASGSSAKILCGHADTDVHRVPTLVKLN
jgi:hypothetical protein